MMGELHKRIHYSEVDEYTSIGYIYNELTLLDLRLKIEVSKFCNSPASDPLEALKGFVISEEEVRRLLEDTPYGTADNIDIQNWRHLIHEKEHQLFFMTQASKAKGQCLRLQRLAELFGLTRFHIQCIMICFAVEMDTKYQKIYAFLHDDVTRKKPTLDLIMKLLCSNVEDKLTARAQFENSSQLIRYNIIRILDNHDSNSPLISCPLKLDDRVVDYLLGFDAVDKRIQSFTTLRLFETNNLKISLDATHLKGTENFIQNLSWIGQSLEKSTIFYFYGPKGSGRREAVEGICRELHKSILYVDLNHVEKETGIFNEMMNLILREAVLQNAALYFINADMAADVHPINSMVQLIEKPYKNLIPLVFIIGEYLWKPPVMNDKVVFILKEFSIPDELERKMVWEREALKFPVSQRIQWGELANKFRFTPGQINSALDSAYINAGLRSSDNIEINMPDIYQACLNLSRSKLDELAQRIKTLYTWKDIILPEDQLEQLKNICDRVKYSHIVYGTWGFGKKISRGKGLSVLFVGPPGTGKTMAAEIMANELGLELYRIDLSRVVSKYIGETEKNLQKIFDEAATSNAILFFDEADALFGKRSEVKDAHDRYANIEISYLLQKMEEYEGLTLLASNLRNNIDEAFMRRIQFLVEFPYPDENYREQIWKVIFPEKIPLDSSIDYGEIARQIRLAGGNIKNIALNAAFYAAAESSSVKKGHIEKAAILEHRKIGKLWDGIELPDRKVVKG